MAATIQEITHFWWKGMKQAVRECNICRRNKHENVLSPGLLQQLPVPKGVWEDIIEGQPIAQRNNSIMVVVDRLTKFAHFLSL